MTTILHRTITIFILLAMLSSLYAPTAAQAAPTEPVTGQNKSGKKPLPHSQNAAPSGVGAGITLGSEVAPQERASAAVEKVPDFSEQAAAQLNSQPQQPPPLRLKAFASPAIYIPGKPLQLKWVIDGLGQAAASGATQLSIQAPAGVTPTEPALKASINATGLLNLPAGASEPDGQAAWTVSPSAKFPLIFTTSLMQNGQAIDQASVLVDVGKFNIAAGGGNMNANDQIKVNVPPGAATQALTFDIRSPSPQQMPPTSLTGNPVEILAVGKTSGQDVTQFRKPINIQMRYDPKKLIHPNSQESLTIYYYDEEITDWLPLLTTVDTVNHMLTAQSDHLTVFDYKANNWQTNSLPTVDGFKVSDFTGAATYSLSFWTPPGPGGMQPNVSLNYNSQVIDESMAFNQASWVGMGWSLDTGSITRNMHGTDGHLADDTFSISVGGISGLLLPVSSSETGNITYYNTADQSFANIRFTQSDNSWLVIGKDGRKHVFNQPAKTNAGNGCVKSNNPGDLNLTWRWSLGSTTDTSGNTLNYTYFIEKKSDRQNNPCINEIAVYPKTILYPNGKYQVRFVLDDTPRTDYRYQWENPSSRSLYGTYRLSKIVIECLAAPCSASSDWMPLRQYVFTYASDDATSNVIYPNFLWRNAEAPDGKTLTLLGVQEQSGDGSTNLPAVSFTYGDQMHVTKFDNGQGGEVSVTYEPWQYFDDLNDKLRSLSIVYGDDECNWKDNKWHIGTGWNPTSSSPFGCFYGATNGPLLQVGSSITQTSATAERSIPENLAKPGARYRLSLRGMSQSGTSRVSWIMKDSTASMQRDMTANMNLTNDVPAPYTFADVSLTLPTEYNPTHTMLQIYCDYCWLAKIQFAVMPSWHRVTSRTVTDTITERSTTYTYRYDNAISNTSYVSDAVKAAPGVNYEKELYTPPLREFRGHAMTQVVDANGLANITWYSQSDRLKGRAYHTLTLDQSFYDGFNTINTNRWTPGAATLTIPPTFSIPHADYDNTVYTTAATSTWVEGLTRKGPVLNDGKMAVAHFRLSGENARGEVGLVGSNTGQFFGVFIQDGVVRLQHNTGSVLLAADRFMKDKWYALELFVDNTDGFRLRLWQLDDPTISAETTLAMPADAWKFRERVSAGTLSLDTYFEGVPYAESETTYATITQLTNTGVVNEENVPYKDLAVTWTRITESSQRNYDGDAAWIGTRSTYVYNKDEQGGTQYGNVTRQTDFASTPTGRWAFYRGTKTQFHPNPKANLLSLPARQITLDCPNRACDFNDESGMLAETLYFYDNRLANTAPPGNKGHLTKTRVWVQNNTYIQSSMAYDDYGNVASQTTYTGYGRAASNPALGIARTTHTEYDPYYHTYAITVRNPLGQPISMAYDFAKAVPISVTDANSVSATAEYDDFGRMIRIFAPGDGIDSTLQIIYHDTRKPFQVDLTQKVSDTSSIRVTRFYDGTGKQIQSQTASARVNGALRNILTDIRYDQFGRPVEQSVPYEIGNDATPAFHPQTFTMPSTKTNYDVLGRTIEVTQPNGNLVKTSYGQTLIGNIPTSSATVTDAERNHTTSKMDIWGRTLSVTAPTGPGLSYEYDVLGQLKKVTKGTGASATSTMLFYDQAGRKIRMEDPDMGTWTYDYDGVGNLTSQTDARSCINTMQYDDLNRLTSKSYSGPDACAPYSSPAVNYYYDETEVTAFAVGRRTRMTDGSGSTKWTYDNRGRMLKEEKTINPPVGAGSEGKSFTTAWTYNRADLPLTMTYPGGEKLTYNYDSAGNLVSLSSNITNPPTVYARGMQYDEAARLTRLTLGKTINRTFTYHPWNAISGGMLASLNATSSGMTVQSLGYHYDANGNISQIDNTVAGETSQFEYDALNRLTRAWVSGGSVPAYDERFEYDANNGNLLRKGAVGALQQYFYPTPTGATPAAHPHAVIALGSANQQEYWYDANGNMTQRLESSSLSEAGGPSTSAEQGLNRYLTYDAENRLISVSQQVTASATPIRTNTVAATKSLTVTTTLTTTLTSTPTLTPPPTSTMSVSPTGTITATSTITATGTLTPSPTEYPTGTITQSPTETITPTSTPTMPGPFVMLSVGWSHACGLESAGTLACWGLNDEGQAAPPPETFAQISAGFDFTCGVKSDNMTTCWGANDNGQAMPPSDGFTQVSAGSDHTCGVKNDGTLACWGTNYAGQSTPPAGSFTQVSTGWSHTCGLRDDGTLACWGLGSSGQTAPPSGIFTQVSAGAFHTCALRVDGSLACWGANQSGQTIPPAGAFTQVSAGNTHNCALKEDGTLACWGSDQYGQSTPPTGVFTQVSTGSMYSCALRVDGSLACWGNDDAGQLGAAPRTRSSFRLASYRPGDAAAAKTATPTRTRTRTATKASAKTATSTMTTTPTPTVSPTPTVTATIHFAPTPTLAPFTGASYVYDGDGRMVRSTVNGVTTYYVGAHYQITGAVVTKYYGSYAMRVGATLYYLLSDHLGSASLTLNTDGQVVAELRYKAFGEVRYVLGDTPTEQRYTGQREQRDLGLYYYGARWYDPALGRFTQADTIIPNAGSSQDYDRYAYVGNNPLNFTDPTGHCGTQWDSADKSCYGTVNLPACSTNLGTGERKCVDYSQPILEDMIPGGVGQPDQLNRDKLTKDANILYDMYLDAFSDPNGWWQAAQWQNGYFSIWDFIAIFWNYEKGGLGNNQMLIASQANRTVDYCRHQCSTAADNLIYLSIFAQAAKTRLARYGNDGETIQTIMDAPTNNLQPGINIMNGIRNRAANGKPGAFDPYNYGNVSLNVGLYTRMVKMGWTLFATDLSEGPNTFFILSYCQSQAAQDAQQNHKGVLSPGLYKSWCYPK